MLGGVRRVGFVKWCRVSVVVVFEWIKLYYSGSIRMGGLCNVPYKVTTKGYMTLGSGRMAMLVDQC